MKIEEVFTEEELEKIRQKAIDKYKYKAPDPRQPQLFVVKCYVETILDELKKKGMIS